MSVTMNVVLVVVVTDVSVVVVVVDDDDDGNSFFVGVDVGDDGDNSYNNRGYV